MTSLNSILKPSVISVSRLWTRSLSSFNELIIAWLVVDIQHESVEGWWVCVCVSLCCVVLSPPHGGTKIGLGGWLVLGVKCWWRRIRLLGALNRHMWGLLASDTVVEKFAISQVNYILHVNSIWSTPIVDMGYICYFGNFVATCLGPGLSSPHS